MHGNQTTVWATGLDFTLCGEFWLSCPCSSLAGRFAMVITMCKELTSPSLMLLNMVQHSGNSLHGMLVKTVERSVMPAHVRNEEVLTYSCLKCSDHDFHHNESWSHSQSVRQENILEDFGLTVQQV